MGGLGRVENFIGQYFGQDQSFFPKQLSTVWNNTSHCPLFREQSAKKVLKLLLHEFLPKCGLSFCPKVCFSMSHPLSCPKKASTDIFEHNGWVNCHLAIMLLSCPAFSWTTDVVAIASRPMSISKNQFVLPLLCTVLFHWQRKCARMVLFPYGSTTL